MNTLHTLRRAVLACALALATAAMAVVALMMLTITYDVLVRAVLAAPTDWAYPLNSAAVLAATSLAVPYFYARGLHISMDLLHRALPPGPRRAADLVTAAATAFLGAVLAVTAFRSMRTAFEGGLTGSGTFSIPLWLPDAVLCVSGAMLTLVAVLFPPGGGGTAAAGTEADDSAPDDAAGPAHRAEADHSGPDQAAGPDHAAEGEARS